MDLLEQYKQQRPEAFREQKNTSTADPYGREYGALVRMAMRLSGGAIKDAHQARYALLAITVVCLIASLLFFFGIPGGSAPTQINTINP